MNSEALSRPFPTKPAAERGILVAVDLREPKRPLEPELDEYQALVEAAGAQIVARVVQRLDSVDPATLVGRGKARELGDLARETRGDDPVRLQRSQAAPADELRKDRPAEDRGSLDGDPRHLFTARAQPRRPTAGGTGAVAPSRRQPDRDRRGPLQARRRRGDARPRRNEAGGRSAPHQRAHLGAAPRIWKTCAARDRSAARPKARPRWWRSSATPTSASLRC